MPGAGGEVVRNGERRRGADELLVGMLAEPFEQRVPAEGCAEGDEARGAVSASGAPPPKGAPEARTTRRACG